MEDPIILMVIVSFSFITISTMESQAPLVFTHWPPTKSQPSSLRHQMVMALRPIFRQPSKDFLYKRVPPPLPQPQRLIRPMKLVANTPYLHSQHNFQSSPPGPHSGEYVFENPFTNTILQTTSRSPSFQSANGIGLSTDRFNPIHTIPAPNLSQRETYIIAKAQNSKIRDDYYEKEHPVFLSQRPNDIHQYQVTEETNDHTINDPFSGRRKLYAPDPDPSLPSYKIKPSTDPFSQPSNTNIQSADLFGIAPSSSALIQTPTSTHFGTSNSQLQQNFLQQQSIVQGMPLSVYNPTYLITKSNQLLDQHKRHLFQPASNYVHEKSGLKAEASNFSPNYSVASPGQIMVATKDASSEMSSNERLPTNPLIGGKYSSSFSESNGPTLTAKEVSDLINFGKLNDHSDQNGFVASSYYESFPESQTDYDITQQQRNNEEILRRANEDVTAKKISVTNSATTSSILKEHQQRLAEQFENSPLRIVVPDTKEQTQNILNEVKRSDLFPIEPNAETDLRREIGDHITISDLNVFRDSSSGDFMDSIDENTEGMGSDYYFPVDSKEDMAHS